MCALLLNVIQHITTITFIVKHTLTNHTHTHIHTHILAFVARFIFYCVGKLHFCVNIYFVDIIQYIHYSVHVAVYAIEVSVGNPIRIREASSYFLSCTIDYFQLLIRLLTARTQSGMTS